MPVARSQSDEVIRLGMKFTVIEIPTSAIKLKAYGISPADAVRRAADAVGHAKAHGIYVTFFPVDSTRTDLTFLKEICRATLDAGADELAVVDTLGACSPEAVELLISEVRAWFGPKLPLHFHGHNDFGLATACAIAAVRAGATWIQEARSTAWESGQAMQTSQRSPWPSNASTTSRPRSTSPESAKFRKRYAKRENTNSNPGGRWWEKTCSSARAAP